MKILMYGINYAPELTGIGKYSGEMAEFFVSKGHTVEFITAPPYYPKWSVSEDYRNKGWWKEYLRGVRVLRCPLYVPGQVNGMKRIIHEFSFLLSSLRWWIPRYFRRYDVVIAISPPFHLAFPALVHKWLHGTKVVNHIQDLQVDAARDLGIIKSNPLLRMLEKTEKFLLKRMSLVSTISTGMRDKLRAKGIPENNILLFPNWVDDKVIFPVSRAESLREEWGFSDQDKIILYAGNLGEKQGLEILFDIAPRFEQQPDIHFLIIGEGGIKDRLVRRVDADKLTNIRFLPLQPLEKLAPCLAAADIHLVLQKKAAADLVMPSKLTNILAVGGHALVTAEPGTTLYDVVSEFELGSLVAPENADAMAEMLDEILAGNRHADGIGARDFAETKLNKEKVLTSFLTSIANT
ncbi:WcaI family glycosyltransferase [Neolewinella agarilytica]|uniref:Colanic acid biosynthesis glycosyl transferase WcaI n=1 Tax=Neolewinella agarilytica TaxID=478744 RepID=A0A1H9GNV1_9BACT|nr:WcaI family glycosyltransferase [Neolewinella agarilytica]SEQ51703.1 colanic acid biosynthesis glycosyl transferase WcaI [Neolewinella agarilytica]